MTRAEPWALTPPVGSEPAIKVLIADDNGLFRDALAAVLDSEKGIEVVGRAHDGDEAARLAGELEPDVVLMDLSMPVVDGFEATRRIRRDRPETCVLVLTGSLDASDIEKAQAVGASGYVTKDRISSELVEAIVSVAAERE